jgi:1-acyl-sn-glycerol-3-phosphate acyltransferase
MSADPLQRTLIWTIAQAGVHIFAKVWFDLKVYGRENLPKSGGVLLATNHESYLDPILFSIESRRPVSYMAKSGLFKNPFLGWLISSLNAYPVSQGRGDRKAIKETVEQLRLGRMVNLYPEGSRTEDGRIGPLQGGIGLIVKMAGVPVVPAVIQGSFQAWPKGRGLFRPYPVRILYGAPMQLEGLGREEILVEIKSTFEKLIVQLRQKEAARRRGGYLCPVGPQHEAPPFVE